ncbi:hypothetical protein [Streptomyces niveus]|uniref:hypothetical protein n=1 Tax=Streptomyces niveus TaxID=193462 RepID=UPI00363C7F43
MRGSRRQVRVRVPRDGAEAATAGVRVLHDHVRVDFGSDVPEVWRECADVLYGAGEPVLAAEMLATYPGCLLVSVRDRVDGRCTAAVRGGGRIETDRVRNEREHARAASALYRLLLLSAGVGGP